ncbi:type-F conjugative transfer system protein TrbI [Shewanella benthica]|nr:type-F conjugative transfer system protein TrbI [Shewanella benthica]
MNMNTSLLTTPTLFIVLSVLLISIGASFTLHLMVKEIVEFDINDTITRFEQDIANSTLSDEKRKAEIQRFTRTLDSVVEQYAKDNNVTVLVSPAIVSGAEDATAEIQQALLNALQAQIDAKQQPSKASVLERAPE